MTAKAKKVRSKKVGAKKAGAKKVRVERVGVKKTGIIKAGKSMFDNPAIVGVVVVVILLLCVGGLVLALRGVFDKDDADGSSEEVAEDSNDNSAGVVVGPETDEEIEDEEEEEEEEEEELETPAEPVSDFSNFSTIDQTLGQSSDDTEYTLKSMSNSAQAGYHRIQFVLESDETSLPKIDATLVSAGGFIQVKLDHVTNDESGLGYQETEEINKDGVQNIYHDISAVQTEEVYLIGIAGDAEFYLHEGTDALSITLDVKYPGAASDSAAEYTDPEGFSSSTQTLSGTNTQGDASLTGYTWSIEASVIKFVWMTEASSENPTPPMSASYDPSAQEVTVTFDELQGDVVIGPDGEFDAELSDVVSSVSGTRAGTKSTFVFDLSKDSTFRIYRNLSPNQVVLEVKR
ncbi:MAG: hypothetical protein U9Q67_00080 [Patescibacteria group bacterium]|nr:hypothetical protein [Patescibacteria group bacterium]